MNIIKFFIALAILAFFTGLALSMVAESYARAGGEIRVLSPSAEATDNGIAIIGNHNRVSLGQPEPSPQSIIREAAAVFFGVLTIGVVLLTISLLVYANTGPAVKSPPKEWTL